MQFDLLRTILIIPGILIGLTFHEYAHAFVADKLGDKTPKFQGRLTLNPIAHVDLFGFIMILIIGFGWAKPVQTNPTSYKNRRRDDLLVSLAGPVANLIVAFVFAIIYMLMTKYLTVSMSNSQMISIITKIVVYTITMNSMLFIFNMLPVPSFDGFHIITDLFPKFAYKISGKLQQYHMIMLVVVVLLSQYIITPPLKFLIKGMITVASAIVGI